MVASAASAIVLGGCDKMVDFSESIAAPAKAYSTDDANLPAETEELGKRYDRDPGEKYASIAYARALRALERSSEAAAVMRTAAVRAPKDPEVLGAYGKALADSGQLDQAKTVLANAYTPDRPNPTIMSAQGVVDDELGDPEGARAFYHAALKIAPGDPVVLNNLGLSYLLTKQLREAEATLRQANASPRADARQRDNLAMVLWLERMSAKAEGVGQTDRSALAALVAGAASNRTLAQSNASSSKRPNSPLAYTSE